MSKGYKVFLSILFIVILGIAAFFYVSFVGLPWKKWIVGNDTLSYLEKKYGEDFEIEDRYFNFKDGKYNIVVHPVKDPDLSFHAGEGGMTSKYLDYYPEAIWEKQADEDFRGIVREIYPKLRNFRASTVFGEGVEIVKKSPIPNYIESSAFIEIGLNLPYQFHESQVEFEKMLKLIQYTQQKGGNIHIFIAFEPNEEDSKDTIYANFTKDEIEEINTVEDVKKYYNNLE